MYTADDGALVPQGTDAFSPAAQFKAWADQNAVYSNKRIYATTGARDAETLMTQGWTCYILADGSEWIYTGSAWVSYRSDTGAVVPTLAASWVPVGSGFASPSYRKKDGRVELFGTMKSGTVSATIFTLPVGCRPLASRRFTVESVTGTAQIDILATGDVRVAQYTTGGSNATVGLDGISFFAEQ